MNKKIVIIGAGPGLGFSIAKKFVAEGFDAILVARNENTLRDMSMQLSNGSSSVTYEVADVSDTKSLKNAIERIKMVYGIPDCVVYNTGITAPDSDNLSAEDLVEHFKVDVAGAYTTAMSFIDEKFSEKNGAIIFTGGGLAMYPADGFLPLSIDKAALRALTYILHNRYKESGVFIGTVTVCGTINGDEYFSSDNIAEKYWKMYVNRDNTEIAYKYPSLATENLYKEKSVEYGLFESNAGNYWGEVYQIMNSKK